MKIKEHTRKLAAGYSKHCFEVVDRTDDVSSKHCFEIVDEADVVWRDFRRVLISVLHSFLQDSRAYLSHRNVIVRWINSRTNQFIKYYEKSVWISQSTCSYSISIYYKTTTVIYTHITNVMKESVIDSLDTVSLNSK